LHPEVKQLLQLQQLDQEIARIRKDLVSLPQEEHKRERRLQVVRRVHDDKKAALLDSEVKARATEKSILQADEEVKKLETRLNGVKNNAEYQATLLHIESVKRERARLEEEGVALLEQVETLRADVHKALAEATQEQKVFEQFHKEAAELRARREGEAARVAERRPGLASGLPRDLVERYEKLFQVRDGLAVCPIEKQVCQGCYTSVTTADYARLVAGTSIVQCGSCKRILYLPE
jgi:predicted  nucleic acid-binding Zn-ribbon protein